MRSSMQGAFAGLTALAFTAGHLSVAQADESRPLAGETVRLVVGYAAGGGFDTYARTLAPLLGEQTGATVVVDNRPGGGGRTATNQMMREQGDGRTLYLINGVPAVLGQVVGSPGMDYDLTALTWLAGVNAETWPIMVNNDAPYESVTDLVEADGPVTFAALSRADGPSDGAATLCAALEIECRIILGFQGTSEASLAVIRGEAQAIIMTDTSVYNAAQGEQARVIGVLGNRRSDLFPDVPTVAEQVELDEDGAFWNTYRANIADVGRAIVAPPGMDEEMTEYLRGVWEDILTDPDVIAEGERTGRVIQFRPGSEMEALVEDIFGQGDAERAAEVEDVLLNRYFN
jgi:tripartite-type tricarboxylate transporter receptor subunit TctC